MLLVPPREHNADGQFLRGVTWHLRRSFSHRIVSVVSEKGHVDSFSRTPGQHAVTLTANQDTPLQPLGFMVDATGGLALTLATNRTDGNCAAQPGGGGIANMTITLVHSSDQSCEPVTFAITGGGAYTVDCATPSVATCIDSNQTLTVMSVPADAYTIHVGGALGNGATCWSNNDSLQVPAAGQTLTKTLNLAYATGTGGCP
jgi:hypothetical protein